MRILLLCSFFPPDAQGGAEITAWNFARWLLSRGHSVGVLTTARRPEDAAHGVLEDGILIWRIAMPRSYTVHAHSHQRQLAKVVWHLQDHVDPRNPAELRHVLNAFRPDFVTIHLLTGLGWNMLTELARHDLPTLFALPDVAIACLRSGMFRSGRDCPRQCFGCRASSFWKQRELRAIPRLGFYSPSTANLARLERYVRLGTRIRRVLGNPNRYPAPSIAHRPTPIVRFIYAGRLHPAKGVDLLLAAADRLADADMRFSLAIVGDGPEAPALRALYGDRPWVHFHGHVDQQRVADLMAASDMLCVPSLWAENAPGVVIQALTQGLPVLASDRGGLPELVNDGVNGGIVAAGDVDAWRARMADLIAYPESLVGMRRQAAARAKEFDPDQLGQALFDLMGEIADH